MEEPQITWKNGVPCSETFRDIYFSREDGSRESQYVFLKGNDLPQRWASFENSAFTILETGFGTGLNFIITAQAFLEHAPPDKSLHYFSIENYPLKKEDLLKSLFLFEKEFEPGREIPGSTRYSFPYLVQTLADAYPARVSGFHRLIFFGGKIHLTLAFYDVAGALAAIHVPGGVDAFYLDGFSPANNADMWSENIFSMLYKISAKHSTLATFTAAGHIRRSLEKNGFAVKKIPGFGKKREMITAQLQKESDSTSSLKPWYNAPAAISRRSKVAIIGAGVAGCALAEAFARRDWSVELFDRNSRICAEASGNPLGIFFPVVHRKSTFTDRFSLTAYLYLLRRLKQLKSAGFADLIGGRQNGLLQILPEKEKTGRFGNYSEMHHGLDTFFREITESDLKTFAGIKNAEGGIFFPDAGYLFPEGLSRAGISLPEYREKISLRMSCEIGSISQGEAGWQLFKNDGSLVAEADILVLANSNDIKKFSQTSWLPIQKIRGQLIQLQNIQALSCPVSSSVYMISTGQEAVIGATHDFSDDSRVDPEQSAKLYNDAGVLFETGKIPLDSSPGGSTICAEKNVPVESIIARVSFRSAAIDHFPVIGPVPGVESYQQVFADIGHGDTHYLRRHGSFARHDAWHRNLYCLAGLGSRGILYSWLGAEIVAAQANGELMPVESDILGALSPARFLYRRLKKGG